MKRGFLLLLLWGYTVLMARPPEIYTLPMQGHTTDVSLKLWLMVPEKGAYTYTLTREDNSLSTPADISFYHNNCWHGMCPVTLTFDSLQPGSGYHLHIYGKKDSLTFSRTYYTLNNTLQPADFSILTGSCFMRGTGGLTELVDNHAADPIYKAMQADTSDLMLWLGDNLYYLYEYRSERGMLRKSAETRLLPEIKGLTASKIHYSIWDDHEFGPNNSDGSFSKKDISARIFKAYWPNPAAPDDKPYYRFVYQDAEFFMLDDRYYSKRTPTPGTHSIIDSIQMSWLKEGLLHSTATFKILCLGSQWFHDKRTGSKDIFQGSEGSESFLQFLADNKISGIILLSGDVHYNMLQKIPRTGVYPLYELSSSAVSSWPNEGPLKGPSSVSSYLVPGTLYTGNNYSTLHFTGPAGQRQLTITTYNVDGGMVWEHSIGEEELK